jgi:hypothetical protein
MTAHEPGDGRLRNDEWGVGRDAKYQLTAGIRKHAHQWGQLGRAPAMGNVQAAASRTGDASGLRLLLVLLLLLIHGGDCSSQAAGRRAGQVGQVRSMGARRVRNGLLFGCVCRQQWTRVGCLVDRTGDLVACFCCCLFWSFAEALLADNSGKVVSYLGAGMEDFEPKQVNERFRKAKRECRGWTSWMAEGWMPKG